MATAVELLGTSLSLQKGQKVKLIRARNLPYPQNGGYFASPADDKWSDGIEHNPDDSILINPGDLSSIELDPITNYHPIP